MLIRKFCCYEFRIIAGWETMTDKAFAIGFHDHLYFCSIKTRSDLMRLNARYAISILLVLININVIMDWKFRRLIVLIII